MPKVWPTEEVDETFKIEDPIKLAAVEAFHINYLYPWQRLVIANILDAVAAQDKSRSLVAALEKGEISKSEFDSIIFDQDGNERGKQIVLLPTGAGKSMCFLVPAIILDGPTLVLYPLLALMSDQERRMNEGGISSVVFRGGQSSSEREENFRKIKDGAKIILANPEVLQSDELVERLSKCNIKHIAIDEAHCVSEWGDTFRPSYTTLGRIIKALNNPVVTAFTATASPQVLSRVSEILFDGHAHVLRSESDRPNIIYHVIKTDSKEKSALEYAEKCPKPLIVFCSSRKRAENLSRTFAEYFGFDKVRFYHAGLEREEKTKIEKWFYPKTDAILCSTCAFGMGVDKKDIKTVIHLDPPPTAESYIQEAGRGGRDGSVANAYLLWSVDDLKEAIKFPNGSRERVLATFAESKSCRRQVLLDALGGEQAACSGCDICNGTAIHYSVQARSALDLLKFKNRFFTFDECTKYIQDKFNDECTKNKKIRYWEISDCEQLVKSLVNQNKLKICHFPWKNRIGIVRKSKTISSFLFLLL